MTQPFFGLRETNKESQHISESQGNRFGIRITAGFDRNRNRGLEK
jgi:hypothetical protein